MKLSCALLGWPLLAAAGSCTGTIGIASPGSSGSGGGRGGTTEQQPPSPDTSLRRLTRTEYHNTIRDLLGIVWQPGKADVNADPIFNGFDNNADLLKNDLAFD